MSGGVEFKIESLWAFLAQHGDDDEGVVSAQVGSGRCICRWWQPIQNG